MYEPDAGVKVPLEAHEVVQFPQVASVEYVCWTIAYRVTISDGCEANGNAEMEHKPAKDNAKVPAH